MGTRTEAGLRGLFLGGGGEGLWDGLCGGGDDDGRDWGEGGVGEDGLGGDALGGDVLREGAGGEARLGWAVGLGWDEGWGWDPGVGRWL